MEPIIYILLIFPIYFITYYLLYRWNKNKNEGHGESSLQLMAGLISIFWLYSIPILLVVLGCIKFIKIVDEKVKEMLEDK